MPPSPKRRFRRPVTAFETSPTRNNCWEQRGAGVVLATTLWYPCRTMPPTSLEATPRAPRFSRRASEEEEDFGDHAGSWRGRLAPWFTPFTNFLRAGRPARLLLGLVGFESLALIIYGARFIYIGYVEADDSKQPCTDPPTDLCWDPRNAAAFMAPLMVWGVALIWLTSDAVNSKSTLMLCEAGLKWCLPRRRQHPPPAGWCLLPQQRRQATDVRGASG